MFKYLNIPNFICIFRVLCAVIFCIFCFQGLNISDESLHLSSATVKLFYSVSIIFVIILDGLDGVVARALKQETEFGAKLDIFCDRLVENIYLIFFVFFLKSLAWWVLAFFIVRGLLVDLISFKQVKPLGNSFLRSSRFMRGFYGFLKVLLFVFLVWQPALFHALPLNLTEYTVILTLIVSSLRALPSFLDS
mgnify:CR=1 FL=1